MMHRRSTYRIPGFVLFTACICGVTTGMECPMNGDTPGTGFPHTVAWTQRSLNNSAGVRPNAIVVADFDGDAATDFAVAYAGTDTVSPRYVIFFRNADAGTFTAVTLLTDATTIPIAASLAAGDLNGDGRPDLIAATNQGILYLPTPPTPRDGPTWMGFVLDNSNDMAIGPWRDVKIGDIDGANGPDIVAAGGTTGRISWFRSPNANISNGSGWTRIDIDGAARAGAAAIALNDLTGDSRLDIISTAPDESTARIAWYANPANPMTDVWQSFAIGNLAAASRLAIGDLNVDGRADVIALNAPGRQIGWYVRPVDATQAWSGFQLTQFNAATPTDIAVVDVDGNSQPDVIVSSRQPGSLRWFTPVGVQTNVWTENNVIDLSANLTRFATIDLDADSRPDIIGLLQAADSNSDGVSAFDNPE